MHRDHLGSPISAVLTGDYRGDGKQELIVCGQQGEVGAAGVCTEQGAICSRAWAVRWGGSLGHCIGRGARCE